MIQYVKVQPDDCAEIFEKSVLGDETLERLLYKKGDQTYVSPDEVPIHCQVDQNRSGKTAASSMRNP